MAQLDFNSNEVPDYDGVPAGSHNVRIVASDIVPTKAGTGKILVLRMKVEDGPNAGKVHFERLNIINPNPMAQQISARTLKNIMGAIGLTGTLSDTEALHNIPFSAKFTIEEDSYGKRSALKQVAPFGLAPTGAVGGQERGSTSAAAENAAVAQAQQSDDDLPWNS